VTPARKKKKKTYHHGNLREALVEEALVLIQERGPEGLTLKELATRLGVTHTAPYRHFPTKEALLSAVASAGFEELRARIEAALAKTKPGSRARFFAGAHAYVRFAVDRPAHFRAMYFGPRPEVETPELLEKKMAAFGLLIEYLREAQAKGTIGKGDPRAIALPIWAMHHGLASLACNGPLSDLPEEELRAMVEEAHAALLDGIAHGVSAPDRLPGVSPRQ
jgi:AcrR family transcriptional regulator